MDCEEVKSKLSDLEDGRVVDSEWRAVLAHSSSCRDCATRHEQLQDIRAELKDLPREPIPGDLVARLRVIALREAARRRRYADFVRGVHIWYQGFVLRANQFMRPLAVPAMGGLASAVVLFSMVMTNFQGIVRAHPNDVPTVLWTDASVKMSLDSAFGAEEITVDVFVDEQGRVIDYAFPEGYGRFNNPEARRKLENSLLFTVFTPATTFGRPTSGWVRVSFRRSEIDVHG